MEALNIQLIDPKAKSLLTTLEKMNIIRIEKKSKLADMLAALRRNEQSIPTLEDITKEVESVREKRYEAKTKANH